MLPRIVVRAEVDELLNRYRESGSIEARDELVLALQPLVRRVANQVIRRLPRSVDSEDLVQSGTVSLFRIIEDFNPERGMTLRTFVWQMLRFAMVDELREADFLPRSLRLKQHRMERALETARQRHLREPSRDELIEELGVPEKQLRGYFGALELGAGVIRESELAPDSDVSPDSDHSVSLDELVIPRVEREPEPLGDTLEEVLSGLDASDKKFIQLYFTEEKTLAEIGAVFGVTESRACQIKSKLLGRISRRIRALQRLPDSHPVRRFVESHRPPRKSAWCVSERRAPEESQRLDSADAEAPVSYRFFGRIAPTAGEKAVLPPSGESLITPPTPASEQASESKENLSDDGGFGFTFIDADPSFDRSL